MDKSPKQLVSKGWFTLAEFLKMLSFDGDCRTERGSNDCGGAFLVFKKTELAKMFAFTQHCELYIVFCDADFSLYDDIHCVADAALFYKDLIRSEEDLLAYTRYAKPGMKWKVMEQNILVVKDKK